MTRRHVLAAIALLLALAPGPARAHCDTIDGPVVTAARRALESGDASGVLMWVQPADEAEVRRAFARAVAVRGLGPEARDLADTYFFETLVRVHRAGEGEPYTGLKAAGGDLGPAIPAVDAALRDGSVDPVLALLDDAVHRGMRERFDAARAARSFASGDVDAGRRYVRAYVSLLHYAEGLHRAARAGADVGEKHAAEPHAAGVHAGGDTHRGRAPAPHEAHGGKAPAHDR